MPPYAAGGAYPGPPPYAAGTAYPGPPAYAAGGWYPGVSPYGVPSASPGTNPWAVAAFVLSVIGGVPFSVICAVVALRQLKRRPQDGRRLAVAGLAISAGWSVLIGGAIAIALVAGPVRDDSGAVTRSGTMALHDLTAGDCVNGLHDEETIIAELPVVPCAEVHEGEVFAVFDLPAGGWPGEGRVEELAGDGCADRLPAYAPNVDPEATDLFSVQPLEVSWSTDRRVTCVAVPAGSPRVGSIRD